MQTLTLQTRAIWQFPQLKNRSHRKSAAGNVSTVAAIAFCQARGYHPDFKVSTPFGQHKTMLPSHRGICASAACPGPYLSVQ